MMPSFFIAHGAPLLAMEKNIYTQFLQSLSVSLHNPKAVVLFSAHWESPVQMVSNVDNFRTIYDFGGFPEELYQIEYPAKGSVKVTHEIADLFTEQEIPFEIDEKRGLDHGAWVVLRMLYPQADIPVISMSVNPRLAPEEQYKIGKSLVALREQDIMIIGSGGTVHNLGAVDMSKDSGPADSWAIGFEEWLETQITDWNLESLFNYRSLAPNVDIAVPPYGNEHFIPLFYAMGAADQEKSAKLLHRSFRYGNLSHSVWQFGE
ncbi:dioxygenase family protein [Cytobacillus sp. NCCP-133]|uniref:dioxygenase family protein n=1 Tax=Cytobacillus sp. NCCP-133 TaxID=766848 RepID=UPI00223272A1|nr:class III extradiol ring-cleavage dioxygenase [Cytobacillus sp. NCCP-133]GLB59588.1 dioxygenase [Cytobacillus sp. NCCP-133]